MNDSNSQAVAVGDSTAVAETGRDHWKEGLNDKQRKALSLLGQGIAPVMVASTLGCSESLISQYLADPRFADEVVKLKLISLQMQTGIDNKYMEAENKLVDKLLKTIPLMTKPMDILRGLQVVNATKRRGVSDGPVGAHISQVVNITLPGVFAAKLITNAQNQVVEVLDETGPRSLITASSGSLDDLAEATLGRAKEVARISRQFPDSPGVCIEQKGSASGPEDTTDSKVAEPKGFRQSSKVEGTITADDL